MKCPNCQSEQLLKTASPNGGILEVHENFIPIVAEIYDPMVIKYTCTDCDTVFYIPMN